MITLRHKEEIRQDMYQAFDEDLSAEDNNIYLYKCFVGLGKTQMYLEKLQTFIEENKTVLIALPTHMLKDDVTRRLREYYSVLIEDNIIIVPEIPDISAEFNEELKSYYAIGDYSSAKKFIQDYIRDVIRSRDTNDITDIEDQLENYNYITSNLRDKDFTSGKIIFTTHERLFRLEHIEPDILIIDEDITQSIINQQSISIDELHSLRLLESNLQKGSNKKHDGIKAVIDRINYITRSEKNTINSFNEAIKGQDRIQQAVLRKVSEYKGNLFNSKIIDLLFNSSSFIKGITYNIDKESEERVSFVVRRNLQFNCKTFIMSATADLEVCQRLFRDKSVVGRVFDIPKLSAAITLRHDYSFSREWFKDKVNNLDEYTSYMTFIKDYKIVKGNREPVKRSTSNQPLVITFEAYEEEFQKRGFNLSLHFGNVTGIDEYKDKNVVVFGTPNKNPIFYSLLVNEIFPEERLIRVPNYTNQLVSNDEYIFYFWTDKDSCKYRKIHMWMVESELIQALGRARPIDNQCQIRIYSNYPPSEIDIVLLNNDK